MSKHSDLLKQMQIQIAARKNRQRPKKLIADDPNSKVVFRGHPLRISSTIQSRFVGPILTEVDKMISTVKREIIQLFNSDHVTAHNKAIQETGMDASAGSQARILTNKFKQQFDQIFGDLAAYLAEQMVNEVNANSAATLNLSLQNLNRKEAGKRLTISSNDLSATEKEMLKASAARAVGFIKSIPDDYLNKVNDAVLNSIQGGNGLADLEPYLEKQGNKTRNWAHNTAMDQTRKTYNDLNKQRMAKAGVTKGEWIHSGGSQHPRPLHQDYDGKTYDLNKGAPVGDDGGNYVQPGEEPNCRCTFAPIITADDNEERDDTE